MSKPQIQLPRDEAPHADPVEWWYVTAQGKGDDGKPYALMCALFKGGVFGLTDVYFAHWFVTDVDAKKFTPHYKVFWRGADTLKFDPDGIDVRFGKTFAMSKTDGRMRFATQQFELDLKPSKPAMLVGGTGFVDLKTSTTHYYSLTRLKAAGKIKIGGKNVEFKGLAWFDHQWSPATYNNEHVWTWFSFQLDDGTDVTCYEYGRKQKTLMATVSWPDGRQSVSRKLSMAPLMQPWTSHKTGTRYPLDWKISIPDLKIELLAQPKVRNQEMVHGPFRYWEGPLEASGSIRGRDVKGHGFLEMNGVPSGRSPFALLKRLVAKLR